MKQHSIRKEWLNFFAVAKSLEIEELCNAGPDGEVLSSDSLSSTDCSKEQTVKSEPTKVQAPQEGVNISNDKYECGKCSKIYSTGQGLSYHIQTVHQGVKYPCNQCDHQATQQSHLNIHIKSKHQGIRLACDQCDYMASQKHHLLRHKNTKHKVEKCQIVDMKTFL